MTPVADLALAPAALRGITRVECIEDLSGLAALRPHWNELLCASAANHPFLTWEWLHTWWTHLRGTAALQTVAAWSDNRLMAVAPLMATRAFGWIPRLEFLGTGHAGSDYLDVIVRAGHEADALPAVARVLGRQRRALRLDHVLERSTIADVADRLRHDGWTASTVPNGTCPVIDLAGHTWDSYLATRGAAHRANVRRRLRALAQQFEPTFEPVAAEPARRDALSALFDFHERRFRAHGGSTAFLTPALRVFHDEATQRMLASGWLRMYTLRLNGVTAAVMYGFGYNGQFHFYQHGFDDRYERHGIGLVLMALTIRAALDEGMHTFDLLWGTEPYKWLWTADARALQQIHLFPPHLGGRFHHAAVEARRRLVPFIHRVVHASHVHVNSPLV